MAAGARRARELGMTLVEMLVVLAIIGVAAGAVALGLGSADRGNAVEAEARQLAAKLRLAADEAMVRDAPLAFAHDPHGYGFVGGHGDSSAFARHDLPRGMILDAGRDAAPLPIALDAASPPIKARIARGGRAWAVSYDGLNVTVGPA